jgi:pimeloyl-ACP methyl ester carboxylesterase
VCVFPFIYLLKGEHAMKDEDLFSHAGPPPSASDHERGGDSDHSTLSPTYPVSQEAPALAHPPKIKRRLMPRHHVRLMLVVTVVVALAGGYSVFRAVTPPSRQASSAFQQVHCPFPIGAGLVEGKNVRCGELTVPEDRSQPSSPTIQLAVAIFKTPAPHPVPDPVLVLGGGPGEAQLVNTGPLINASNLARLTAGRDFILLDQRGEGYSQPSLNCLPNEIMQACHDRLVEGGINLNAYTTLENAADVHDLVRVLGYKQVNLEGRSYGTRLALTMMRLFPADLRSVVLISVFPPQVNSFSDKATVTQHAFDVFFQGCMADPHCNTTYPHLQTVFYRLVTDLNSNPITFQTTNPQTGTSSSVEFTGNDLMLWLFNALYSTNIIPQLPAVLFQILRQNYAQLSQLYGSSSDNTTSWGLFYSVECGEDMASTTPQRLQASVQVLAPELRPGMLASLQRASQVCQLWSIKPVPVVQKERVISSIPTLIMEGEYDPVTPPSNGLLAAQTLSRSFFFLFPGVTHGVKTTNPCPDTIEHAFLDHPTVRPDASCISRMPEPIFT